jgi:hypothetical protein
MGIDHPLDATAEQLTAWALEASKALEIHKSQIRQLTTTNTVLRRLMRATCPSDDLRQSSTDRAM